ncbi:MAG: beta-glucosidase, partial [Flavobacterium sp.]
MKQTIKKTAKASLLTALVLSNLSWKAIPTDEKKPPLLTIKGFTFQDFNRNGKLDPWEDTRLSANQRIEEIIKQMTNAEKAELLIGTGMPGIEVLTGPIGDSKQGLVPGAAGGTAAFERFGIPATIVADGPAGLRIEPT